MNNTSFKTRLDEFNQASLSPYLEIAKQQWKPLTTEEKILMDNYLSLNGQQVANLPSTDLPSFHLSQQRLLDDSIEKDFNAGLRFPGWDDRVRFDELMSLAKPLDLDDKAVITYLKELALQKMTVIYLFWCVRTGSFYIGQTVNLVNRIFDRFKYVNWNVRPDRVVTSFIHELARMPEFSQNGSSSWYKGDPLRANKLAALKSWFKWSILEILPPLTPLQIRVEREAQWIDKYSPGLQGCPTSEDFAKTGKEWTSIQNQQRTLYELRESASIASIAYSRFGLNLDAAGNILPTGPALVRNPNKGIKVVAVHVLKSDVEPSNSLFYVKSAPEMMTLPSLSASVRRIMGLKGTGGQISFSGDWLKKNSGVVITNPVDGSKIVYWIMDQGIARDALNPSHLRLRLKPLMSPEDNPTRFTELDFSGIKDLNLFFGLTDGNRIRFDKSMVNLVIEITHDPKLNGRYQITRAIDCQ